MQRSVFDMIVAHLIGGNEIQGIRNGVVFVNDKKLETSYEDLGSICGNISLGDAIEDYVESVIDVSDGEYGASFVTDNHLLEEVVYSTYEVDFDTKELTLRIHTYN